MPLEKSSSDPTIEGTCSDLGSGSESMCSRYRLLETWMVS